MECYYHSEIISCTICEKCKKKLCHQCINNYHGKVYCIDCFKKIREKENKYQQTQIEKSKKANKPIIKTKKPVNSIPRVKVIPQDDWNILSILSFSFGIGSLFFNLFFAIPAVILGLIAKKELKKNKQQKGDELATAGLILGILFGSIWFIIISLYFSIYGTLAFSFCSMLGSSSG